MSNLQNIRARLDKLERNAGGGKRYHFIYVPGEFPDSEDEAYEAALAEARAKYEAEHGPISERDTVLCLRCYPGRRREGEDGAETAAPDADAIEADAETATEAPQSAPSERTDAEPIVQQPERDPASRELWRQRDGFGGFG